MPIFLRVFFFFFKGVDFHKLKCFNTYFLFPSKSGAKFDFFSLLVILWTAFFSLKVLSFVNVEKFLELVMGGKVGVFFHFAGPLIFLSLLVFSSLAMDQRHQPFSVYLLPQKQSSSKAATSNPAHSKAPSL